MREMRDSLKVENIMSGIFDELLIDDNSPVVVLFGADKYVDTPEIFSEQSSDGNVRSYLSFRKSGGKIIIDGLLKDELGRPLLRFENNRLDVFSGDLWDIERKSRSLKIINRSRQIWFQLHQGNDSEYITFTGKLFVGGRAISVANDEVRIGNSIRMTGNTLIRCGCGMRLPTPLPWRPLGHVNPGLLLNTNVTWL
jgi:hypothetical protein